MTFSRIHIIIFLSYKEHFIIFSFSVGILMMNSLSVCFSGKFPFFLFLWKIFYSISFLKKDFIYLFTRGRSRLHAGSRCGTWSQDPRITTWAYHWATQVPLVVSSLIFYWCITNLQEMYTIKFYWLINLYKYIQPYNHHPDKYIEYYQQSKQVSITLCQSRFNQSSYCPNFMCILFGNIRFHFS